MKHLQRRQFMVFGGGTLACAWASKTAFAETAPFPSKPITVKVAFPAGGPADASIRAASVVIQRSLNQLLIADNVPGANGSISAMNVLRAEPDGYTLLGTTGTDFMVAPLTVASARYQPQTFKLLGITGQSDFVLVTSPEHPFKTVAELIAYAKNPANKPLSIGHWGTGSAPHIVAADFQLRTGIKLTEIPYKGAAPTITDVAGGNLDLTFTPPGGAAFGMIQNGKLRALGITSPKRNPALPELAALAEDPLLAGFEYSQWAALLAPPKTSDLVVARLTAAMNDWLVSPENDARTASNVQRKLSPMSPAQAAAFLAAEYDKFTRVARSLKLDPQ